MNIISTRLVTSYQTQRQRRSPNKFTHQSESVLKKDSDPEQAQSLGTSSRTMTVVGARENCVHFQAEQVIGSRTRVKEIDEKGGLPTTSEINSVECDDERVALANICKLNSWIWEKQ
ncbi:hypothetical protein Tco_0575080 [Tanacetum coccineum]